MNGKKKCFFGLKYISEAVETLTQYFYNNFSFFFLTHGSTKVQNMNTFATSPCSGWAADVILLNTLHNHITYITFKFDILQHLRYV